MTDWDKFPKADDDQWAAFPEAGGEEEDLFGVMHGPAIEGGSILPFSKDAQGRTFLDFSTGVASWPGAIWESIKSGVTAPGDIMSGKLKAGDPDFEKRAMDTSTLALGASPGALTARAGKAAVPTVEALKEASEAGYNAARNMGVEYTPNSVQSLAAGVQQKLEADGVFAELSPKTFSILKKLQDIPADAVSSRIENLDAARKALNNAAADFNNPVERLASKRVIDELDAFIQAPPAESVLAGPAAAAGAEIKEARGNYAAAKRSDKVTGAEDKAELNAAAANSGLNVDNQLRQRIRDIVNRPKDARGYSPEELEFMRSVVKGTHGSNAARWLGNFLGGGGGLGAVISGGVSGAAGAAAAGPMGVLAGAAIPAIGYGSKKLSAAMVKRQLRELDELIRQRSPLFKKMQAETPDVALTPAARMMLMRSGLLGANQTEGAR